MLRARKELLWEITNFLILMMPIQSYKMPLRKVKVLLHAVLNIWNGNVIYFYIACFVIETERGFEIVLFITVVTHVRSWWLRCNRETLGRVYGELLPCMLSRLTDTKEMRERVVGKVLDPSILMGPYIKFTLFDQNIQFKILFRLKNMWTWI